jgi:hypothetical protein
MKKTIFTIFLAGLSALAFSQDTKTTLKKDIVSVELGLFTAFINYERHLDGLFTLKSELGLGVGFGRDFFSGGEYFVFTPIVILEPRYYYNFNRRVERAKKTSYNASNYFALAAGYFSNPFIVSNVQHKVFQSEVFFAPKWGIKRSVGRRFNFEFAFGAGLYFSKAETDAGFGLDLRFGYNIK